MSDIQLRMTSTIKALVSRKKKRYKEDGFNLDLTYIYDNIIAMGYPAAKLEGVYRNHINDVFKFLETKHKDHYKIYNLCSERSYDVRRFHDRVSVFPFEDHNPPKLELIKPFCSDVDEWLSQDPQNVAVVHCKAGKGRTGLMICCYILHRGWSETADEALRHYGQTRTHDKKGVTIPSQRRYVGYYDQLLKSGLEYSPRPLLLHEVWIEPIPNMSGGCVPVMTIFEAESQVQISPTVELTKANGVLRMTLNPPMTLKGDVRLTLKNKPNVMMLKEKMFHFWFNTFFVKDRARLPPCTPSHTSRKPPSSPGAVHQSTNGSDNSHSLTKAAGLAFGRLSVGLSDRFSSDKNDRGNLAVNPHLQPGSRASSLNSIHTDKPSSTNSASTEWLTLTLTKRELDRACKDTHHRIFTADFKVTLYFTPASHHHNVGSLPNMAESPSSSVVTSTGGPSVFNHVMSAPTLLPTAISSSTNGSARKDLSTDSRRKQGHVQQQPSNRTGIKPSSPQSLGLLGPICWRIPTPADDQTDGSSTRKFRCEAEEEDGCIRQILDSQGCTYRHSDSSQWSSEENDSSDVDSLERNGSAATGVCVRPPPTDDQDDDDDDEEEDDDARFCSSSVTVGRYRLLSYSVCNSSAGFHAMYRPRQSPCQQQEPQQGQQQLQQPPSTAAQSPK